jgi:hypothetical protein
LNNFPSLSFPNNTPDSKHTGLYGVREGFIKNEPLTGMHNRVILYKQIHDNLRLRLFDQLDTILKGKWAIRRG